MHPPFDLLSLTCQQFASCIAMHLGKGREQAAALYREWYHQGTLEGRDPCFANAQRLHKQICELIALPNLQPKQVQRDQETTKFTLLLEDGYESESVLIPMQRGLTLCISSQVGCRMGCRFCETGRLGLIRQLTVHEILRQVACAKHHFGAKVRNIVFMGMGEPMDNLEAVIESIDLISGPKGFEIGRRHITVSTSGHLEGLRQFTERVRPCVNLAVSVIAPNDELRTRLMPINRRWDMAQLYRAMRDYCEATHRSVLVEYVLIEDLNDLAEHAQQLANYLEGLKVKVNLIPYNAQSQLGKLPQLFRPSPRGEVFAATLRACGLRTLWRGRKGHEIMGACGQLGNLRWRETREGAPDLKN